MRPYGFLLPDWSKNSLRSLSSSRSRALPAVSERSRSFGPRPTATRSWWRQQAISSSINPFDPLAALTPVAKVAEIPIVFCSNPSVQAHDLAQFIAYARAHRGKLNYGSPGNGSVNHLLVENFKRVADIEIAHIPYRGSPPATLAAVANEIQLYAIGLAAVAGHLKEGKLTALAVTANQRLPMLPEVQTVVEAGFPSLAISNWWGMAAPKQTSDAVIGVLHQAIAEALSDTTVVERFATLGMLVPTQTREQFVASLSAEADFWSQIIQRGKFVIE